MFLSAPDADVAPRLPLFAGWLTWCWKFDYNWAPFLVPSIHEKNITCEFNTRTVESAQNLLTRVDECLDASAHQP